MGGMGGMMGGGAGGAGGMGGMDLQAMSMSFSPKDKIHSGLSYVTVAQMGGMGGAGGMPDFSKMGGMGGEDEEGDSDDEVSRVGARGDRRQTDFLARCPHSKKLHLPPTRARAKLQTRTTCRLSKVS